MMKTRMKIGGEDGGQYEGKGYGFIAYSLYLRACATMAVRWLHRVVTTGVASTGTITASASADAIRELAIASYAAD